MFNSNDFFWMTIFGLKKKFRCSKETYFPYYYYFETLLTIHRVKIFYVNHNMMDLVVQQNKKSNFPFSL